MMILTLAIVSAIGILFMLFKCGDIRKVLAFDLLIDIGATVGLAMLFYGTLGGMAIAAIGGLIITVALWLLKKALGHQVLTVKGWQDGKPGFLHSEAKWRQHI